jgi:predicted nucleic acid-binding protein
MGLGSRKDLSVVDMDDSELIVATGLRDLRGPTPALGPGEASVIAIAEGRNWSAGIDETLARDVLATRGSGVRVRAIRDVLSWAVARRIVNSDEAREIDHAMRMKGYKGPQLFVVN